MEALAHGTEGFGGEDARTSIFDYWSMPEFTKWVNGGKFDGGKLSPEQKDLRAFYTRLLNLVDEPAFRSGSFIPFSETNLENPAYGRLGGEKASGHWLYSFMRVDPSTGQAFLVAVNLNPTQAMHNVRIRFPAAALQALPGNKVVFTDRLAPADPLRIEAEASAIRETGLEIETIPPLTPLYLEVSKP
jgi:hypothetical protein